MKTYNKPATHCMILSTRLMASDSVSAGGVLNGTQEAIIPKENWGAR